MTKIDSTQKRTGVTGFMAKVLNESGTVLINIFDGVAYACTGVKNGIVKTPEVTKKMTTKTKEFVSSGVQKIKPLPKKAVTKVKRVESKQLQDKIKKREKKIASLYYEIGKEGSKISDQSNILEQEPIKKLIADAKGYEKEIERLKSRITELESASVAEKKESIKETIKEKLKAKAKPVTEVPPRKRDEEKIARARAARAKIEKEKEAQKAVVSSQTIKQKNIRTAIQSTMSKGQFKTPSEKAKFETVAKDLMDSEIEIRMLAAAELSKMGNTAAVPVLIEIAKENDPYLVTETLNSLINLGDKLAIPTFKQKIDDDHYRVRIASLRGLYKLLDNEDDLKSILIKAIRDDHPEVRKSAVTFIGWKDYSEAVPSLVQTLSDEDERVKKSAISALANIRDRASVMPMIKLLTDSNLEIREKALSAIQMIVGEEIAFDIRQSNDDLTKAVKDLKEWWQQKRIHGAQEEDIDPLDGLGIPALSSKDEPGPSPQKDDSIKPTEKKPDTSIKMDAPEKSAIPSKQSDVSSKNSEEAKKEEIPPKDTKQSDVKATLSEDKKKTDTTAKLSTDKSSPDKTVVSKDADKKDELSKSVSASQDSKKTDIPEKKADTKSQEKPETKDSKASDKPEKTKEELKKMPKSDLISMGKDMGLNPSETQTKSSIVRNILDQQKKK